MTTTIATTDEALELIAAAEVPVLLNFGADWCPPCTAMAPVLDRIADEQSDRLEVRKVDVDALPDMARRFDISSAPTLILFADGEQQWRLIGAQPRAALLEALADHI